MTANATTTQPRRFDAPTLSEHDSLRVLARHDATSSRRRHDAGFQQGHAEGYAAGRSDVEAAIADHRRNAERLESLCAALEAAVEERRSADAALLAQIEDAVVATSLRIAEQVLEREVADRDVVVDTIRRSLLLAPGVGPVIIRLHPEDVACAAEALEAGLIKGAGDVEIVPESGVARGGCVVDGDGMRVDSQLDAALARLGDALRS